MKEREEFEKRQAERTAADEARTAKKREKRNKKKVRLALLESMQWLASVAQRPVDAGPGAACMLSAWSCGRGGGCAALVY